MYIKFGDSAQWWSFYLIALATGSGWWKLFSLMIMTYILHIVSGMTLLEKRMRPAKPGYEEYQAATNAFIPWSTREQS